jgi:hypothetical protein
VTIGGEAARAAGNLSRGTRICITSSDTSGRETADALAGTPLPDAPGWHLRKRAQFTGTGHPEIRGSRYSFGYPAAPTWRRMNCLQLLDPGRSASP